MRWVGRVLLGLVALLLVLVVIVLVRTASFRGDPVAVAPAPSVELPPGVAERLAAAIRIRTISHEDPEDFDAASFVAFQDLVRESFPALHTTLVREIVGDHSLLFTWVGSDPALDPILLMGHIDVVPVEAGTEELWTHPPFAGVIAGGFIWGRGAIDNKPSVMGTLEAVEMLIGEGFRPARTIYLAYGHDEEVGGARGAALIASLLQQRGVRLAMVLDEGGVIGDGLMPGLASHTALVGIAEKGYLSVELTARATGGHSSMPADRTAIGAVSRAVVRLEQNPHPARLDGAARALFEHLGPELPALQRAAFANLWLTRPLVLRQLEGSPSTAAMIRTTTAATIFEAGTRANVLPSRARAVVNFRILPGDSVQGVIQHVRRVVADPEVSVGIAEQPWEPSQVSSTDSWYYRVLHETILRVVPGAIVAPYLVLGATDARHYRHLSDNVYRFLPIPMNPADLERMHGTDERIGVEDYRRAVLFYRLLIADLAGLAAGPGTQEPSRDRMP